MGTENEAHSHNGMQFICNKKMKSQITNFSDKWIELEKIILSDVTQVQ